MKRELDLIRAILLKVEALPVGDSLQSIEVDGYSEDVIAEHVWLLEKSGYLEARIFTERNWQGNEQVKGYLITRLLNEGHDFIADAKNDSVWQKATAVIREKSEDVSLAVVKAVVAKMMLQQFGL